MIFLNISAWFFSIGEALNAPICYAFSFFPAREMMLKRSEKMVLQLMEQAHEQGLSIPQVEAQEAVTRATVLRWIRETGIGLVNKNSHVAFEVPAKRLPMQASLIDQAPCPTSSSVSLTKSGESAESAQFLFKIDLSKLSKVSGNKSYVFEVQV